MRRIRAGFLAVVLVAVGAGCGATHASIAKGRRTTAAAATIPGCTTTVAKAPTDTTSGAKLLSTPSLLPFGVAIAPHGTYAFVSAAAAIDVYSLRSGTLHPSRTDAAASVLLGDTLTPNGRYLLAATSSGAVVYTTASVEHSAKPRPVGTLSSTGVGAIEVKVSPNGEFAFVALEDTDQLAVFNLSYALAHGFGPDDLVGYIPLGDAPVGMSISPDGRYMFATSESENTKSLHGTITTINLAKAEVDPVRSVVSSVAAGCEPVRVVSTSRSVFVAARASDAVLEFSTADLEHDSKGAFKTSVKVGEEPVGLTLVRNGADLVVGDSNRFGVAGAHSSLAVVGLTPAGGMTLRAYLPAGRFPRDMALSPNGRLLLICNYASGQLEVVPTPALAHAG